MNTRRTFLAGTAGLTAASIPLAAGATVQAVHPDAELIRLCAQHIVNLEAFNQDGGDLEPEDDPLAVAYVSTLEAICAAKVHTVDGMIAKARAAKAEARQLDGTDGPSNTPAAAWAWDILNDLLDARVMV